MRAIIPGFFVLLLTSCSPSADAPAKPADDNASGSYQVIAQDLQALKNDFNANQGRIRLLFLSGPTCGICLRGMADLNDAFLAEHQDDERLITFVVHVPTMGAKEKHVAETIPLLDGPGIRHYWEDTGIIGQHFSEVMEVDLFVWDFWAIYGPDARWEGLLPPQPEYYEHQLGVTSGGFRGFPKDRVLDAERFAAQTLAMAATIPVNAYGRGASTDRAALLADGTEIAYVGQPRNVAVRQHIVGRGGYKNLKRIRTIAMTGQLVADDQHYELRVTLGRPNDIRREVVAHGEVVTLGDIDAKAADTEKLLVDHFEFDGMFVEWPDKGHKVSMQGMRKFDDVLAWRLTLDQAGGPTWNMYVDSHTGDLVQKEVLDDDANIFLGIRQSDFRDVAGFRFPHRIEYLDRNGGTIAVETFDDMTLDVDPLDADDEMITH